MYLDLPGQPFGAGHESAGVTAPALGWFFAEGATGSFFDLFILLSNPNATAAQVQADYLLPDGTVVTKLYAVLPTSRFNVWVDFEDAQLADTAVSVRLAVLNGVPVIAERAMWWVASASPGSWFESHNSPGATTTGIRWGLAEGEVGGARNAETFILVANTSGFAGSSSVKLVFEDGGSAERVFALSPNSRFSVDVGSAFPSATGRKFGAIVTSLATTGGVAQIVVERATYEDALGVRWAAGSAALGTRLP